MLDFYSWIQTPLSEQGLQLPLNLKFQLWKDAYDAVSLST